MLSHSHSKSEPAFSYVANKLLKREIHDLANAIAVNVLLKPTQPNQTSTHMLCQA